MFYYSPKDKKILKIDDKFTLNYVEYYILNKLLKADGDIVPVKDLLEDVSNYAYIKNIICHLNNKLKGHLKIKNAYMKGYYIEFEGEKDEI